MCVFLKGCNFDHTELSTHFLSFNEEYAVVKEGKDANPLSLNERARVNLQLNLCPSKSTTPVLKQILFQYLKVNLQLYNWNSKTVSIF